MKYDVVVVGARCAGSPTAMLLARRGYRVLLVDRSSFPSDIMSSHFIHAPGVAKLKKWGLVNRIAATDCPAVRLLTADLGAFRLEGQAPACGDVDHAFCVRRKYLDKVLVDAAVESGVELREEFTVEDLVWDGERVVGIKGKAQGGSVVTESARLVVGADGMRSLVARLVGAREYNSVPALTCNYYSYWSGLNMEGAELFPRDGRFFVASRTNDDLSIVNVLARQSDFHGFRSNIEGFFFEVLSLSPAFADRIRQAKREERFVGTSDTANFFRAPFGSGWALAGDAGYHRDPITAQGITDAFRDAELLSEAVDAGFSGRQSLESALKEFQVQRDAAVLPMYHMTCGMARLEPPGPEQQAMFEALRTNRAQTDRFFGTITGTVSPADFYAPDNLRRLVQAAN